MKHQTNLTVMLFQNLILSFPFQNKVFFQAKVGIFWINSKAIRMGIKYLQNRISIRGFKRIICFIFYKIDPNDK